jgi:predicted CXXCH cytochrome family protein
MHSLKIAMILLLFFAGEAVAKRSVVDSLHNLSTSGPGAFKSQSIDDVCVFCHSPHTGKRTQGLWNRNSRSFRLYQSSTSDALPSPSQLSSELCLSCHDGTIALGQMLRPPKGRYANNNDLRGAFLSGRGRIGNDMRNHHPVAISYDDSLTERDHQLVNPGLVDLPLPDGALHCISCHDPHASDNPPFLYKTTLNGELCTTCHKQSGQSWEWSTSAHALSDTFGTGANPWKERKAEWKGKTVAENACMNCHMPHNAATGQRLISGVEEQVCFRCHDGTVGKNNIKADSQNFFRHPVEEPATGRHDTEASEDPFSMALHVECEDCHNPHGTRSDAPMISFNPSSPMSTDHTRPPLANGTILGVKGLDINGTLKDEIEFEYELCFKCHGLPGESACGSSRCSTAEIYRMQRQDQVYNLREKVNPGNPSLQSYHPFDANNPANNNEVPSLRSTTPLNSIESRIYCGDCHSGALSPAAGGTASGGPHGSRNDGLLALKYEFNPVNNFSPNQGLLCLKCHDASSLYNNESFPHRQHVLDKGLSCINCHDPHGSTVYPHLLNFLTSVYARGKTLTITGAGGYSEPTWIDNGQYSGTCYLNCHGTEHDGTSYGMSLDGTAFGTVP